MPDGLRTTADLPLSFQLPAFTAADRAAVKASALRLDGGCVHSTAGCPACIIAAALRLAPA